MIEKKNEEIQELEARISKERREKLQNYEIMIKMTEADIRSAKYKIEKEQIYKHKLLNDEEENEITRKAANELYLEYVETNDSEKRRQYS